MKKKLLAIFTATLMVVALIPMLAFPALAEEDKNVTINATVNVSGGTDTDGTHFDVVFNSSDIDGWKLYEKSNRQVTISSKKNEIIKKIEFNVGYAPTVSPQGTDQLTTTAGTFELKEPIAKNDTLVLNFATAVSSVTIGWKYDEVMNINSAKIYYAEKIEKTLIPNVSFKLGDYKDANTKIDITPVDGNKDLYKEEFLGYVYVCGEKTYAHMFDSDDPYWIDFDKGPITETPDISGCKNVMVILETEIKDENKDKYYFDETVKVKCNDTEIPYSEKELYDKNFWGLDGSDGIAIGYIVPIKSDTPKTADSNNMILWIVLAIAAAGLATGTVLVKRTDR